MTVNDFFDGVVVINLKKRQDRLALCRKELEKEEIEYEVFFGFDHSTEKGNGFINGGQLGCYRSHLAVADYGLDRGWRKWLILEDDVIFSPDFREFFSEHITELPEDWYMFFLGGNHYRTNPIKITKNIIRVHNSVALHCYGITALMARTLLVADHNFDKPIDNFTISVQRTLPCYAFTPTVAFQRADFSDIAGRHMNYNFCLRYNL